MSQPVHPCSHRNSVIHWSSVGLKIYKYLADPFSTSSENTWKIILLKTSKTLYIFWKQRKYLWWECSGNHHPHPRSQLHPGLRCHRSKSPCNCRHSTPLDYAMEPTTDRSYIPGLRCHHSKSPCNCWLSAAHTIFTVKMKLLHSYIGRSLPI